MQAPPLRNTHIPAHKRPKGFFRNTMRPTARLSAPPTLPRLQPRRKLAR